jgi:hypothetical protein
MGKFRLNIKTFCIVSLIFFASAGKSLFAQNTDTVRVHISDTVFNSVTVFDTIVHIDTVWVESKISGFETSIFASSFFSNWRKYNDEVILLLNQRNYSFGVEARILFNKWSIGSGIFFSSFNENRQFGFKITDIDSIIHIQLIPNSYQIVDTISVSWEYNTYDSTYFDPGQGDSITVTITDSIPTYQIDTTTVNYNDTIYNTTYDTIQSDTITAKRFRYTYLEVPLIVKFNLYKTQKFSLDAGLGIISGLLIKSESYFFDVGTNTVLAYSKGDTYKFLPSLWFSLGLNYALSDKLFLSLVPYYNPGIRTIYNKDLPIVKIPDRYGVKFGLSYRF